jgi:hypothetical protein
MREMVGQMKTGLEQGLKVFKRWPAQKLETIHRYASCLEAMVEVEMVLCFDTEYNKAFKSRLKGQAAEKARMDKGKGKAHHNFGKDHSL